MYSSITGEAFSEAASMRGQAVKRNVAVVSSLRGVRKDEDAGPTSCTVLKIPVVVATPASTKTVRFRVFRLTVQFHSVTRDRENEPNMMFWAADAFVANLEPVSRKKPDPG